MKIIKLLVAGVVLVFAVLLAFYAANLSAADDVPDERLALHGLDENLRFEEPVTIDVALWDRWTDVWLPYGRDYEQPGSFWTKWVQEQMLERHNVVVEWVIMPRRSESDIQSFLLAAAAAPDIGYTFRKNTIEGFSEMGGILNLLPYLQNYGDWLPNLYDLLGESIYWGLSADETELFYISGRVNTSDRRVTFIREDWLEALNLPIPQNLEEYEYMLRAFRDRQDELPFPEGLDIVPLGINVWWRHTHGVDEWFFYDDNIFRALADSFLPSDITDRDLFVYGFNNNRFHHENAAREAARVLNRWYHEGFFQPSASRSTLGQGNVGSFAEVWDAATGQFWNAPASRFLGVEEGPENPINYQLRQNVGPDARFIAIAPFLNDEGEPVQFIQTPTDRFIFLPHTNRNVVASLLYLDFMSRPDTIEFLQFGIEDMHNFDVDANLAGESMWEILQAREVGFSYLRHFANPDRNGIAERLSESGVSWLLERGLSDSILNTLIRHTSPANFDARWQALYQEYLDAGSADIINERRQAWDEAFGGR